MFDTWNNAPWTARGLKFKHAIEVTLTLGAFLLILGIAGRFE